MNDNINVLHFLILKKINNNIFFVLYYYYIIMNVKSYVRQHLPLVSISLFLIIFGIIQLMIPAFLYNNDGSLKEFGVGYKNKTILPVWLLAIVLGILSYCLVRFYVIF
jgi:uncharacterized membrane protein YidH (DUF202 family)